MVESIGKNTGGSLPSATTGLHSLSACCTSSETCTEVNLRSCMSRAWPRSSRSIPCCDVREGRPEDTLHAKRYFPGGCSRVRRHFWHRLREHAWRGTSQRFEAFWRPASSRRSEVRRRCRRCVLRRLPQALGPLAAEPVLPAERHCEIERQRPCDSGCALRAPSS